MRRICLVLCGCLLLAGCGVFDAAPQPGAQTASPADIIAPGDMLRVTVAGEDELSGTFAVAAAGSVRLELLGVVQAGGLTPAGFAERLRQRLLAGYLKDPQVAVARAVPEAPRVAGMVPPPPALRQSETYQ